MGDKPKQVKGMSAGALAGAAIAGVCLSAAAGGIGGGIVYVLTGEVAFARVTAAILMFKVAAAFGTALAEYEELASTAARVCESAETVAGTEPEAPAEGARERD